MHLWTALTKASPDVRLLWVSVYVRMAGYGMTNQVLALYLEALGVLAPSIGVFMTLTLVGDTVMLYFLTWYADRLGRRAVMCGGAAMMLISGLVFAYSSNYYVLLLAAVVGVISSSGDETGPFKSIEEACIAHLTPSSARTEVFALYGLFGSFGLASGALLCGYLVDSLHSAGWEMEICYRMVFLAYMAIAVVKLVCMASLLADCEVDSSEGPLAGEASQRETLAPESSEGPLAPISDHQDPILYTESSVVELTLPQSAYEEFPLQILSERVKVPHPSSETNVPVSGPEGPSELLSLLSRAPETGSESPRNDHSPPGSFLGLSAATQRYLPRLLAIFMLDSLGAGFMLNAWIVYFFKKTYGVSATGVGVLFFWTSAATSVSSVPSALLSRLIGPVRAILATQVPGAVFLLLVASSKTFLLSAVWFFLTCSTSSMDVVPRQVLLTSIMPASDLTKVMGLVNIGKTLARCVGPVFTGLLAAHGLLEYGFYIDLVLVLAADVILASNFLHLDKAILVLQR